MGVIAMFFAALGGTLIWACPNEIGGVNVQAIGVVFFVIGIVGFLGTEAMNAHDDGTCGEVEHQGILAADELAEVDALDAELEAALNGETLDPNAEVSEAEKQSKVAAFLERLKLHLREADPMGQAVSEKARGAVVNGGRKKQLAKAQRDAYARHKRQQKRINPRYKLGRYTAPAPRPSKDTDNV